MNGTISRLLLDTGFGFITRVGGQEYFMHRSAVRDGSVFDQLRDGQSVTFDASQGEKVEVIEDGVSGYRAARVVKQK
jgi:cold shock CspA family protein